MRVNRLRFCLQARLQLKVHTSTNIEPPTSIKDDRNAGPRIKQVAVIGQQPTSKNFVNRSMFMSQYFWLLCGVWCGIAGALYTRFQLRKYIVAGEFTKAEVNTFTRNYALWIFLPCLAFWLLQQSIGGEAPPEYFKWSGTQKTLALALQVFLWAALLYWVFLRRGANTLSRYLGAVRSSTSPFFSPVAFKVTSVLVVLAGVVALLNDKA